MEKSLWIILIFIISLSFGKINPKDTKLRTFGTAIKDGQISTVEQTVFEHSCDGGGSVTEMWWAGPDFAPEFPFMRIRFYIDGETTASIDYQLYMAHGIGWGDDSLFFGNKYMGKNSYSGGIYHTFRIPFGKSIKVTAQLPWLTPGNVFWCIIRGLERLPVIMGDIQFPNTTRLRLYKYENVTAAAHQYVPLVQVNNKAGAIFLVTVQAESPDLNFLEGCFRAYIDDASVPIFLSSGTEDFFLSCSYFAGGEYYTSEAGLTHLDTSGPAKLSMFKFFHRDPLVFNNNIRLMWRDYDDWYSCPRSWPPKAVSPMEHEELEEVSRKRIASMTFTSYVWVYEWS